MSDDAGLMGVDLGDQGDDKGVTDPGRHPADDGKNRPPDGENRHQQQGAHPAEDKDGDKAGDGPGDRPEFLPEQFWDPKSGANLEKLAKSYSELRGAHNKLLNDKGGKVEVPEEAAGYLEGFEVQRTMGEGENASELKNVKEFGNDDPALVAAAEAAKKAGLSKDQFGTFASSFLHLIDGLVEAPLDVNAEIDALGGKEKAIPLIKTNKMFIETMARSGQFSEEEAAFAQQFAKTAVGLRVLNKLRVATGEKPIPSSGEVYGGSGAKSEAEIQAMMNDPRYKAATPQGDAYRAEVAEEIDKLNAFKRSQQG